MTGSVPFTPTRQIAPGVAWLGDCVRRTFDGREFHLHHSAFVVTGGRETLLIDTGHPEKWDELENALDQLLGARSLDWIWPTHPEPAHAGNLGRLLRKFPSARVTGDVRDYPMYFPDFVDRLVAWPIGQTLDLGGGYQITAEEALIKDLPSTQWAYESSQQILFVADGFAYSHGAQPEEAADAGPLHESGECRLFSSELKQPPSAEAAAYTTRNAVYWSRYVDVSPIFNRFDEFLDRNIVKLIAPAHGGVIDDLEATVNIIRRAYDLARLSANGSASQGTVNVSGPASV